MTAFRSEVMCSAGWVKPGEMTALMGVSGAGKVCYRYELPNLGKG